MIRGTLIGLAVWCGLLGQGQAAELAWPWILWEQQWSPLLKPADTIWKTKQAFESRTACEAEARKVHEQHSKLAETRYGSRGTITVGEEARGRFVFFAPSDPVKDEPLFFGAACWPVGTTPTP
jgi:hypothetical protein